MKNLINKKIKKSEAKYLNRKNKIEFGTYKLFQMLYVLYFQSCFIELCLVCLYNYILIYFLNMLYSS